MDLKGICEGMAALTFDRAIYHIGSATKHLSRYYFIVFTRLESSFLIHLFGFWSIIILYVGYLTAIISVAVQNRT